MKTEYTMLLNPMEIDTDRRGGDYKNFALANPDPSLCEQACINDPKCKAFTYTKPNAFGTNLPHCWLKNTIPAPTPDSHFISGVKNNFIPSQGSSQLSITSDPPGATVEVGVHSVYGVYTEGTGRMVGTTPLTVTVYPSDVDWINGYGSINTEMKLDGYRGYFYMLGDFGGRDGFESGKTWNINVKLTPI
jgi:hypothetical protein